MSSKKSAASVSSIPNYGRLHKIGFIIVLIIFVCFIPGQNIYTTDTTNLLPENIVEVPSINVYPYPVNVTGIKPSDSVTANGIVIRDIDSGAVLYSKNPEEIFSPASTTKLLTALVSLEVYQLDDVLTVKTVITEGQTMGLFAGEQMTVENLLYGILIHSANDAAYTLAENYKGGYPEFIQKMNAKAKEIGLTKSSFTNPIGFDDPNHKMTALDLSKLSSAAMNNKTIVKMVAIPLITISDITHSHYHNLKNVNQLLGKIPGVAGIKTGWTEEAGENLITLVIRNNHRVVFVVLNSKDRFGDTTSLIDWVFANIEWQVYSPKN